MPERRREAQRRKRRSDKRSCSSTIEESSSSANKVNSQRKRARCYIEPTPPSSLKHIQTGMALHLHINTCISHDRSSHRTVHHELATFHCSVTRLETHVKYECGQVSLAWALLNAQDRERYAGVGPSPHERDWTVTEQPGATQTDQRSWRLSPEQPGLCDEGRSEPAYLGLPAASVTQPAPPRPTMGEFQEAAAAAAETTLQGGQGAPLLCAAWPSCRRSLGNRRRSHASYGAEVRRFGACRHCGTTALA